METKYVLFLGKFEIGSIQTNNDIFLLILGKYNVFRHSLTDSQKINWSFVYDILESIFGNNIIEHIEVFHLDVREGWEEITVRQNFIENLMLEKNMEFNNSQQEDWK